MQLTYSAELVGAVLKLRETYPRWGKDKLTVLLHGEGFVAEKMEAVANRLRSKGYKPFIYPEITTIIGPVGWVNAADELIQQLKDNNIKANYVILANGGGGTQGH